MILFRIFRNLTLSRATFFQCKCTNLPLNFTKRTYIKSHSKGSAYQHYFTGISTFIIQIAVLVQRCNRYVRMTEFSINTVAGVRASNFSGNLTARKIPTVTARDFEYQQLRRMVKFVPHSVAYLVTTNSVVSATAVRLGVQTCI